MSCGTDYCACRILKACVELDHLCTSVIDDLLIHQPEWTSLKERNALLIDFVQAGYFLFGPNFQRLFPLFSGIPRSPSRERPFNGPGFSPSLIFSKLNFFPEVKGSPRANLSEAKRRIPEGQVQFRQF